MAGLEETEDEREQTEDEPEVSAVRSNVKSNRYIQIIETVFRAHYVEGAEAVDFTRDEIAPVAEGLGIKLPKNLGDIPYSFRYRASLPESITSKAPPGRVWVIRPMGRGLYQFALVDDKPITPSAMLSETKVPDSTPGVVLMYSGSDEQALLAKLRYNRLIDIFTGVTSYSLQNHLRTTVTGLGQVETDEIYIGVDRRGAHYVFPVQAKGRTDRTNIVQIEQDIALCRQKYPNLICQAIAAQFMAGNKIALFAFEDGEEGVKVVQERHYRLVPQDQLTQEELRTYRERPHI